MAEPVAVCDVYRPRLEAASKKTGGAKMYMEHEALLADQNVDVVCIATPDRLHAPQTIDALNAGKDVYCEKPLTHWSQFELAKKVQEAADKNGPAGAGRHAAHGRRQLSRDHPADPRGHHRQADARHLQLLPPRRLGRADAHSRRQRQARPRPALGAVPGRCPEGRLLASRGSSSGGCTGTTRAARPPTCWCTPSRPSSACSSSAIPSGSSAAAAPSSTTAKCPTSATSSPTIPAGRAW